jgi:hypothetical protein
MGVWAVNLSAEQLQMAALIDAKVQRLVREGHDEVTLLGEMFDCMPIFKILLDSGHDTMGELCRRFAGFYHYAKILETLAAGIQSGAIQVPK